MQHTMQHAMQHRMQHPTQHAIQHCTPHAMQHWRDRCTPVSALTEHEYADGSSAALSDDDLRSLFKIIDTDKRGTLIAF